MCSKIFIKIHAVLRKLHMIQHMTTLTMCPIAPWPMCPIPQGAPSLPSVLTMIPICPCAHMSKKMSSCQKRCQVVNKMSSCQKDVKLSKSQTHGLWRRFTKKINWQNEVHTLMSAGYLLTTDDSIWGTASAVKLLVKLLPSLNCACVSYTSWIRYCESLYNLLVLCVVKLQ